MPYDPTAFEIGDVISAERLAHMEQGIADAHGALEALGRVTAVHVGRVDTQGAMVLSPGSGWGVLPRTDYRLSVVHPMGHVNYVVHLTPYGDGFVAPCWFSPGTDRFDVRGRNAAGSAIRCYLDFKVVEYEA